MELGKKGYISQISIYLRNKDHARAYPLSKEFAAAFPDELIARFLLAESAYWSGEYHEAAIEGHRAFNKATDQQDLISCALVAGSAHLALKEYAKGLEILRLMEMRGPDENVQKMLLAYSLAMRNPKEAAVHLNELYKIDRQAALETADRFLKG